MKRIAIIGAGNAGCITALHYYYHGHDSFDITIYHNPQVPIERVGQGLTIGPTSLIGAVLNLDWVNNPLDATFKTGFMYEGWGKKTEKFFHPFALHEMAMHYVPQKLSETVLKSGLFNVIEKDVQDTEKEIDADFIFDCRGRTNRDPDLYEPLINPLNSVLLCSEVRESVYNPYTRGVATPNGWAFVIPKASGNSYGYLYNNEITSKDDACADFVDKLKVDTIDGQIEFENYVAKDIFVGERTILNGNKAMFLEPLEASAMDCYHSICKHSWDYIHGKRDKHGVNVEFRRTVKEVQNFVLWHYQFGSKYDTPFWKYAKSLPFKRDFRFNNMFKTKDLTQTYGFWVYPTFRIWKMYTS